MEKLSKLEELFCEAMRFAPSARIEFTRQIDDSALRSELNALLSASSKADSIGFLRSRDEPPPALAQLDGYRVLEELGHGGSGVVYSAVHQRMDRFVAIKVLRLDPFGRADRVLRREAKALGRLSHPGIAHLYDARVAQTDFGAVPYTAMELVDGASLLTDYAREEDLSIDDRVDLLRQVADAMAHAHLHGVCHLDLKPSNILVDASGVVKVVDFGVARVLRDQFTEETRHDKRFEGSLPYMAPEQALLTTRAIDERADIYALGVVLYELLTGKLPHGDPHDSDWTTYLERRGKNIIPSLKTYLPAASPRLQAIVSHALKTEPGERYFHAGAFADDLGRFLRKEPILAKPPKTAERVVRWCKKRRHALSFSLLFMISASLLAALMIPNRAKTHVMIDAIDAITGMPIEGADVLVASIDSNRRQLGEWIAIGQTPVNHEIELPGDVRLIVDVGDERFAELTRRFAPGTTLSLSPKLSHVSEVTQDMVYIRAGRYVVGKPNASRHEFAEREVAVDAFWIDRREVSNAEYLAFCEATGHARPAFWGGQYNETWNNLPVIGVTASEARSYAEWSGKRLPTDIEWEAAARYRDGRLFSWGDDATDMTERAVIYGNATLMTRNAIDDQALRAGYEQNVVPVGAEFAQDDVTETGLLHMQGNVAEWTDSVFPAGKNEQLTGLRIVKGDYWGRSDRPGVPLYRLCDYMIMIADSPTMGVGFRCAKSASISKGEESP